MTRTATILALLIALISRCVIAQSTQPAVTQPASVTSITWLDSLDAAYKDAERTRRPIFAYVGANWCEPCHRLRKVLADPVVAAKLSTWTCVYIDFDKSPEAARALGASSLPAMRAIRPEGAIATSIEGFMMADELVKWLDASGVAPHHPLGEEFLGSGLPDDAAMSKLIDGLINGSPSLHEAAIRRLLPHPQAAARPVVEAFAAGALAQRLATLDLLREWHAPVDEMDPWHADTINDARLAELRKWAAAAIAPTTQASTMPTTRAASDIRELVDALLNASTPSDVTAARERLVLRKDVIKPELDARLRTATLDLERERLTALRYRLAATDRLSLNWPGGLERLASTNSQSRRDALTELGQLATADDSALLLELFSSADPLLRETSLRLLRATGGGGNEVLVKLLADPEPNVRAAVLKQFAENPEVSLVKTIAQFAAEEKDADLAVHAVRVLRATQGIAATKALVSLMENPNWRVRAEAIDAIAEMLSPQNYRLASSMVGVDVVTPLRKALDDADPFVIGRASLALLTTNDATQVKPIFVATQKHEELLPEIIAAMEKNPQMASAASTELEKLTEHPNVTIAASAIKMLASSSRPGNSKMVLSALNNTSSIEIRLAGAEALMIMSRQGRPTLNGYQQNQQNPSTWLDDWLANKTRPKWMQEAREPLVKLLADATAPRDRVIVATALLILSDREKATPIIATEASSHSDLIPYAEDALSWLPWDDRLKLFDTLLGTTTAPVSVAHLVNGLTSTGDERAIDPLWAILAKPDAQPEIAAGVQPALMVTYFGQRYVDRSRITPTKTTKVVESLTPKASSGPDLQRLVALSLITQASPDDGGKIAATTVADATASAVARSDAFQMQLLTVPKSKGESLAASAIADPMFRKIAVSYLAAGSQAIQQSRGGFYVQGAQASEAYISGGAGNAIVVEAPKGISVEQIRPLLSDADARLAAHAGYLLATLHDRSGLDQLIAQWRRSGRSQEWTPLVYRAIVALNDDEYTPVLHEVYQSIGKDSQWEMRPFYWTIRTMKGPKLLKLRKQIRDEVGMQQLQ